MNGPPGKDEARGQGEPHQDTQVKQPAHHSALIAQPQRWRVIAIRADGRRIEYASYRTRDEAIGTMARLIAYGLLAEVSQ